MVLPGLVRCSAEAPSVAPSIVSTGILEADEPAPVKVTLARPKSRILAWPRLVTKNIGGLDVAVNDVFGVCSVERVGDFDGESEEVFDVHGVAVDAVLERLAIEKFHGDESVALLLTDIVNRADVGMVQGGGGLRFALESRESLRIARDILRQKFQRDEALEARVFGLVNDTHASAAELFDDAVV
jgi:hypothetical protein